MRIASLTLLVALVGCDAVVPTTEMESAIENGQIETGYPAVGYIYGGCTGVLIAPSWVLSIDHCRLPYLTFTIGTSFASPRSYYVDQTPVSEPNTTVMLLHISPPITDISPLPLGQSLPWAGTTCIGVGFGDYHDASGALTTGTKRSGVETVVSVPASTPGVIEVGPGPTGALADHGDSGGPLICNGGFVDGIVYGHNDSDSNHVLEEYSTVPFNWIEQQTNNAVFSCKARDCTSEGGLCGVALDYCGGELPCGSCPAGKQCSTGHCCPTGTDWNGQSCVGPLHCGGGMVDCGGYCCRCRGTTCG